MRKMNILLLGVGAVVLAFGVGWFACGGWKGVATRYDDDASFATTIGEIRVAGSTVAVEVRPGTAGVQIHRTARYLNPFHGRPGSTYRIDGSTLELGGDDTAFGYIEYVVTAPVGVRVTADVGTGSLDLTGVSTADLKVGTGSVTLTDATGNVTTRVGTGEIKGRNLRSDAILATTGTGSITLELATPADVEASTSTGSLALTVPAGTYRVDAATGGLGKADVRIPNDPNGRYHLSLRTGVGELTLAAR